MRELITFFAIVGLSLASGAPAKAESDTYYKGYDFITKEVIHSFIPIRKDEVIYAACEGSSNDKKCTIYVEKPTGQRNNTVLTCSLNLKFSDNYMGNVLVTNAGNSRAVLSVRDGDSKLKLISVDMKNCRNHQASIDVWKKSIDNYRDWLSSSVVVPHENNYDVFFRNKKLCDEFLCKVTFDYEGKVVKAASVFPVKDSSLSFHQIEYSNNGYLFGQSNANKISVYLVKKEDSYTNRTLYTRRNEDSHIVGLSTEENKFGFCMKGDRHKKVVCKQYDADGETKKIKIELFGIDNEHQDMVQHLDMFNLERGFLVLSVGLKGISDKWSYSVAHVDEQGKKGKTINVETGCQRSLLLAKLYKNSDEQYCVNSICVPTVDDKEPSKFSRTSTCFLKSELF